MESENQVLRQQTLVLSPTKGLSNRFKSTVFQVGGTTLDAYVFSRACLFFSVQRHILFVQEVGYCGMSHKTSFLVTESGQNVKNLLPWLDRFMRPS